MNLFLSQYVNKIDKKGRISLPSLFRNVLSYESKKNELFDTNSVMLIGEYGGITLGNYFKKHFIDIDNIKQLEREFLKLMNKMKDMFKGLVEINNYDISHLDIKPDNIVISKGNFKFIDFGLSNKINKIDYFKKRSYNEFQNLLMFWK